MNHAPLAPQAVGPEREDEIRQFQKIIQLRDRIMDGEHPQFKPPSTGFDSGQHAVGHMTDASTVSKPTSYAEQSSLGQSHAGRGTSTASIANSKQVMKAERARIEAILSKKLREHNHLKLLRQETVQEQLFVNVSEIYDMAMRMAPPKSPSQASSGFRDKWEEKADVTMEDGEQADSGEYVPSLEIGEIRSSPAPEDRNKRARRESPRPDTRSKTYLDQSQVGRPPVTLANGRNPARSNSGESGATIVHNQLTSLAAPQAERVSLLTSNVSGMETDTTSEAKDSHRRSEDDSQYRPREERDMSYRRQPSPYRGDGRSEDYRRGEDRYYESRGPYEFDRYNVPYSYGPPPVVYSYDYDRRPSYDVPYDARATKPAYAPRSITPDNQQRGNFGSAEERYGPRSTRVPATEAANAADNDRRPPNGNIRTSPDSYERDPQRQDPQLRYARDRRSRSPPYRRHDEPQRVYVPAPQEVIYVDEYGRPLANPPRRIVVPTAGAPYEYQAGRPLPIYYEPPVPVYGVPHEGYPPGVIYGRPPRPPSRIVGEGRYDPQHRDDERREGPSGSRPRSVVPGDRNQPPGHGRSPPIYGPRRGEGPPEHTGRGEPSDRSSQGYSRTPKGPSRGNWGKPGDFQNRSSGPRY